VSRLSFPPPPWTVQPDIFFFGLPVKGRVFPLRMSGFWSYEADGANRPLFFSRMVPVLFGFLSIFRAAEREVTAFFFLFFPR